MTNANDQQVKPQLTLTPSLNDAPVPELVAQPPHRPGRPRAGNAAT